MNLVPLVLIERRALAAASMAERLRSAGFAARMAEQIHEAAAGELVLWMMPTLGEDPPWLRAVERHAPAVRLIAIGDRLPQREQVQLLLAGVSGYLDQRAPWETVLEAVRGAMKGERWFSAATWSASIDALRSPASASTGRKPVDADGLTARELQLSKRVALGESNKEIAAALCLSMSTVKTHLQHIFAKLGVESRVALALLAASQPERFGLESEAKAARAGR